MSWRAYVKNEKGTKRDNKLNIRGKRKEV